MSVFSHIDTGRADKSYAMKEKKKLERITMSFSNTSLVKPKSARRGGGVVNRAGQGAKPLPLAL